MARSGPLHRVEGNALFPSIPLTDVARSFLALQIYYRTPWPADPRTSELPKSASHDDCEPLDERDLGAFAIGDALLCAWLNGYYGAIPRAQLKETWTTIARSLRGTLEQDCARCNFESLRHLAALRFLAPTMFRQLELRQRLWALDTPTGSPVLTRAASWVRTVCRDLETR